MRKGVLGLFVFSLVSVLLIISNVSALAPPFDCQVDADCNTGEICEGGYCTYNNLECKEDWNCPGSKICLNSKCVYSEIECQTDWNCPGSKICLNSKCVYSEIECKDDWDCPNQQICLQNKCVYNEVECTWNWNCPGSKICLNGKCQYQCEYDADCNAGEICKYGNCIKQEAECIYDFDCPFDTICVQGKCIENQDECQSDLDCPGDSFCIQGDCQCECSDDWDCPHENICQECRCVKPNQNNSCYDSDGGIDYYLRGTVKNAPPSYSGSWTDKCTTETNLQEGSCKPGLGIHSYQCPYGCENGACLKEPKPTGCTSDIQCKGNRVCVNGNCEYPKERTCKEDWDCPESKICLNSKCVYSEIECKEDWDCPGSKICRDGKCQYQCEYDADCNTGEICKYGNCIKQKAECIYNFECPFNAICVQGKCIKNQDECQSDLDCPGDSFCIDGSCSKNPTKGFRYSYWECYSGKTEKQGSSSSCKSAEIWKYYATEFCKEECYKNNEKCGVNSFSVSGECYIPEIPKECEMYCELECPYGYVPGTCNCECMEKPIPDSCPELKEIECPFNEKAELIHPINPEKGKCPYFVCSGKEDITFSDKTSVCENSCFLNGKCYPFGYRKSGMYCSDEGLFVEQLPSENECENNFECDSNLCLNAKCIDKGFIQKLTDWLKGIFS